MDRSDLGYPQVVLVGLTAVVVVGLVLAATTSSAAFGSYNQGWDGASSLQDEARAVGAEGEIVRNTSQYSSRAANDTVAVVLSPETGYGPTETDRLRAFVRRGGTLVVAEDFGNHSNALLARIGAQARVGGDPLRDEQYNYRSPAFPVARNVSNASLMEGVGSLTLNHGTSVEPSGATVLASTSPVAYLDTNANDELDDSDQVGTYPVATAESVGEGRVVVVGDPSLFINAMLDRAGNRAFVQALFAGHERVLLDYSHAGSLPPLSVALLVIRDAPLLQVLFGGLCLGVLGSWIRPPSVLRRLANRVRPESTADPTPNADDLSSFVRKQHPDWDDERIDRVIRGIMTRRGED